MHALVWCRVLNWQERLNKLYDIADEQLHVALGVDERFHRFREVSGVPAIEAAKAELNARLAARGALLHALLTGPVSSCTSKATCSL